MHHVPYTYVLHSGKTVIQHVYDSHYEGAAMAATYAPEWRKLEGKVDPGDFELVLRLFTYQAGHAMVWRDAVNDWFHQMSGIDDAKGRVGHHPGRIEAEDMTSDGYTTVEVKPWETASGGRAVVCARASGCSLSTEVKEPDGRYRIAVQYFDLRMGASHFELLLNGKPVGAWVADDTLPPAVVDPRLDGHTSTGFTLPEMELHRGDILMLRGQPDGGEEAPVDYLELSRAGR